MGKARVVHRSKHGYITI